MTKVHCQLCIAILGLLVIFMVGVDRVENEGVCSLMSLLLQYFTMASVFWMGAEAVLMFQKLIIVFGQLTRRYFATMSLICWCK